MKRLILTALSLAVLSCVEALAVEYNPEADENAVVTAGNARFTVLTSRLVRMEWSEDGVFEDRATLGVVNRKLPVPSFKVRRSSGKLTIDTGSLRLVYSGAGKFSAKNLSVTFTLNGKKVVWTPGTDDSGNLLGTARTLDRWQGDETIDPFDKGVVSRDGWALVDESDRHVFESVDSNWKNWVAARSAADRCDWYIFAYGHDYKSAVSDYTKIGGNIPMVPKYAFGYWWSRYWQYSDSELLSLAKQFRKLSIPLDVVIIDMDWHETWDLGLNGVHKDESGERKGWCGYTWKKELFPNPGNFFHELKGLGLKTSLNLHPASGIQTFEAPYDAFVKDYISRTSDYDGPKGFVDSLGKKVYVPFRADQMEWADSYFKTVIAPFEKQGVDFWWLDWQQYRISRYVNGLSNTFWLNHLFFTDKLRNGGERPMIYHRWGGLGSHRYQVGFSGDTFCTWKVLSRIPWFTCTASNVGYGYWGHDIGGHARYKNEPQNMELYLRWLQSAVFTPVFKTHCTKDANIELRFWMIPEYYDSMSEAVRLRYDLSPYIYNASREAFETGISICRPLYYYCPENEKAYSETEEFMFGPDILATAVCHPADSVTRLSPRHMWFPEGNDWYEVSTGTLYRGGSEADLEFTLSENPWFVKAGAVIPMASSSICNLQDTGNEIRLLVAPGLGKSEFSLYEDDGLSSDYETVYAKTLISKETTSEAVTLRVSPRKGSFRGAPGTRLVRVLMDGVRAASVVEINGAAVPYSRFAQEEAAAGKAVWGYDGHSLRLTVYVPESSVEEELTIKVMTGFDFVSGQKGLIGRMPELISDAKYMFNQRVHKNIMLPESILGFGKCGSFITEDPSSAGKLLGALDREALKKELASFPKLDEDFVTKVLAWTDLPFLGGAK